MKLDRNLDRNADNFQRTITNVNEREASLEATGGIPTNSHEQRSSYPPFGPLRYYSLPIENILTEITRDSDPILSPYGVVSYKKWMKEKISGT